jgi:hypothetical protein
MPENNTPITDAELAELRRWLTQAEKPYEARYKAAKRDAQAMVTRFVPSVLTRLEAAERERDCATDDEAGHWIGIIRSLDPENLCDMFDGLGFEQNLRQWLATRDAKQRREGAAQVWERLSLADWLDVDQRDRAREEAGKLREGGE